MKNSEIKLAAVFLVVLSLIWGYNWVVMKQVLRYADPFDFAALRTLFGALALLVGGGAGKTAVLTYTMPFWLLPMAWVALGERVRGLQWVAIGIALIGLLFILEPWHAHGDLFSTALALLAGAAWAASAVIVKRLRARTAVDLMSLTAWQMLCGALALCALALWLPSEPPRLTPYFIGALIYNALPATGLAWLMWVFILDRMPAGLAGLSALAIPAVSVLSSWVELGERPSAAESLGMLCIAVALGLVRVVALRGRPLTR